MLAYRARIDHHIPPEPFFFCDREMLLHIAEQVECPCLFVNTAADQLTAAALDSLARCVQGICDAVEVFCGVRREHSGCVKVQLFPSAEVKAVGILAGLVRFRKQRHQPTLDVLPLYRVRDTHFTPQTNAELRQLRRAAECAVDQKRHKVVFPTALQCLLRCQQFLRKVFSVLVVNVQTKKLLFDPVLCPCTAVQDTGVIGSPLQHRLCKRFRRADSFRLCRKPWFQAADLLPCGLFGKANGVNLHRKSQIFAQWLSPPLTAAPAQAESGCR